MDLIKIQMIGPAQSNPYPLMKPWEDYYPMCLMSGYWKVSDESEKILYSMYYLQPYRFEYLLSKYTGNIWEIENYYKMNILTLSCSVNHPSNLYYKYNYQKYDQIFWTVVKLYNNKFAEICDLDVRATGFIGTPLRYTINERHIHYFFALLNYGFKLDVEEILKILDYGREYYSNVIEAFLKSDKLLTVMNSIEPVGRKLLSITEDCPINMSPIVQPVIIEDGTIYEYSAIMIHFSKNGLKSPMTNQVISPHIYLFLDNRFEKVI